MPDHREADTRLLTCIALLTLPEDGPDADRAPRRPAAERLREQLGPELHARLLGPWAGRAGDGADGRGGR
jgi:hypothetical protein